MRASHKPAGLALSTVTLDEWERIRELFEVVLAITPDRRSAIWTKIARENRKSAPNWKVCWRVPQGRTAGREHDQLQQAGRTSSFPRVALPSAAANCSPIVSASYACLARVAWARCMRRRTWLSESG